MDDTHLRVIMDRAHTAVGLRVTCVCSHLPLHWQTPRSFNPYAFPTHPVVFCLLKCPGKSFFALRAASLMSLQCTRRMERPSTNTDLTETCVWIHSLWTQVVDSKFQRRGRHPIAQKSACPLILINSESVGMNRIRRLRQDGWLGTETPTVWVTYVPSRNRN